MGSLKNAWEIYMGTLARAALWFQVAQTRGSFLGKFIQIYAHECSVDLSGVGGGWNLCLVAQEENERL